MLTPKPDITEISQQLELIESGGRVKRYHTVPTIATESVAAHSYLVAWFVKLLSAGTPRAELLLAALQHDIAEFITGDLPSPSKKSLGISYQFERYEQAVMMDFSHEDYASQLSLDELHVLKMADCLAGMSFCIQERKMGNQFIESAFKNYSRYVEDMKPRNPEEAELILTLNLKWENANGNR